MLPDQRYLINVGSVGDPRDGQTTASYVIYDQDKNAVKFRQVPFDVESFKRNLAKSQLPVKPFFIQVYEGAQAETQTIKDMEVMSANQAIETKSKVQRISRVPEDMKARKTKVKFSMDSAVEQTRQYKARQHDRKEREKKDKKKGTAVVGILVAGLVLVFLIIILVVKGGSSTTASGSNPNNPGPGKPPLVKEKTIQQLENGDFLLEVADANARGSLNIDEGKTKNWNSVNQALAWKLNLSKTGYFDVYVTHMKEIGESEIELSTPDSSFKGTVTASDEAVVKLGNFEITNDNIFFITLKSISAGDVTSLKSVKLKYLGERKPNPFGNEPDAPFTSFEERSYPAGWQTTGSAFNPTPLNAGKMYSGWEINGAQGKSVAASVNSNLYSSLNAAAKAKGELTSPEFLLKHDYINMLIAGGDKNTKVSITLDGYKVKSLDLPPPKEETNELRNANMNVSNYVGKKVRLVFTDNSTKHFVVVDRITLTNKDNKEIKKIGGGDSKITGNPSPPQAEQRKRDP